MSNVVDFSSFPNIEFNPLNLTLDDSFQAVVDRISSLYRELDTIKALGFLIAGAQMGAVCALYGTLGAFLPSFAVAITICTLTLNASTNYQIYKEIPYRVQISAFRVLFGDLSEDMRLFGLAKELSSAIQRIEDNNFEEALELLRQGAPFDLPAEDGLTAFQIALNFKTVFAKELLEREDCVVTGNDLNFIIYQEKNEWLDLALPKLSEEMHPAQLAIIEKIRNREQTDQDLLRFFLSCPSPQQYLHVKKQIHYCFFNENSNFSLDNLPEIMNFVRDQNNPEFLDQFRLLLVQSFAEALSEEKQDLARVLINTGTFLNTRDEAGNTPLQLAVTKNAPLEMVMLILQNEDYVFSNEDFEWLLHYDKREALDFILENHSGKLSFIELLFLLEGKHANYKSLIARYHIFSNAKNLFLLRRELNYIKDSLNNKAIYELFFDAYLKKSRVLTELLEEIFPDKIEPAKVFYNSNMLGNVWGVDTGFVIQGEEYDSGGFTESYSLKLKEDFFSYTGNHPYDFSSELSEAIACIGSDQSMEQILEKIKSGKLVSMHAGWNGHVVYLIMYKGWITVCNRGSHRDNRGLVIYSYDPALMTLEELRKITRRPEDDPDYLTNQGNDSLHANLGMVEVGVIPMKAQNAGNCSWASSKAAVYAGEVVVKAHEKMERSVGQQIAIQEAVNQVRPKYKSLTRFFREKAVKTSYSFLSQSEYADAGFLQALRNKIGNKLSQEFLQANA